MADVVFLDRDGVINSKAAERDYVKNWADFEFFPRAKDALKLLWESGFRIFVVSNQRGVARGIMTKEAVEEIHKRMRKEILPARFEGVYFCPHDYSNCCDCRKPKPGMLLQAAKEHRLNLKGSFFVGDSENDVLAGKAVGCRTILVGRKREDQTGRATPDYFCRDLHEATELIISLEKW